MKRLISIFAGLLILLFLSPAVLANADKVVDEADLLTTQQEEDLAVYAESIINEYDMDVVIVIVSSLEGKTAQAYADDYFDYNGYGIGDDYSGVLFLLAIEDRAYAISTSGEAIDALSDRDIDELLDCVYDDFRRGSYYLGLRTYLDNLESEFYDYAQSKDSKSGKPNYASVAVISLAVGAGAGGIGLATMRSGMKTAKPQVGAQSYLAKNSFTLPVNHDTFLYSRTSRTRIQNNSSGGGGRGSTHTSSSGRSHGGGSRKF
ncbi:MAG: TPM domain-containing protein [Faecousia sp.]